MSCGILKNITEDQLKCIAQILIEQLDSLPSMYCLSGEIGVGKTTFSRYVIEMIGTKTPFSSPTYTIVNLYNDAAVWVQHFDLYRVNQSDYDWIYENIDQEYGLYLFEWADLHPELFADQDVIQIHFSYAEDMMNRDLMIHCHPQYLHILEEVLGSESIIFTECDPTINDRTS